MVTIRADGELQLPDGRDVLRRQRDPDPGMAAEVDLEASRWAEIVALVELLTPDERGAPGYFMDPDWSVKDLVAHLGWWHAEARSELLKIATRMYEPHDFDIDRRNAETLAARRAEPWDLVWARATGARAWMLEAWFGLGGRSTAANQWVRKAGAEHYGEHLDRLREWASELIDLRTRPRVDERDP
jgi:hypothetical protein